MAETSTTKFRNATPTRTRTRTLLIISNALTKELGYGTMLKLEGTDKCFTPKAAYVPHILMALGSFFPSWRKTGNTCTLKINTTTTNTTTLQALEQNQEHEEWASSQCQQNLLSTDMLHFTYESILQLLHRIFHCPGMFGNSDDWHTGGNCNSARWIAQRLHTTGRENLSEEHQARLHWVVSRRLLWNTREVIT